MSNEQHTQIITELRNALPILKEKSNMGLIYFDSHQKAESLLRWHERGLTLTDKQVLLIGRLLQRARRKHKKIDLSFTGGGAAKVDTDAIIEKVVEQVGDQRVDVSSVIEGILPRVLAHLEERAPRKVEIVVQQVTGKMHNVTGPTHRCFDKLLRMASGRDPETGYVPGIMLQGEASSGKTTACAQLAKALGLKFYTNGAISFAHDMLGFNNVSGYQTTPFRMAYEHGGVYCFDEIDRSDPNALLAVNPHLANGYAAFPDGMVKRHPDCIIIATANTWGLGADAQYSGATKLDGATLSRFPGKLCWDIDPELESAIVQHPEWLARVRRARERARLAGLQVMICTRIAQAGATYIRQGFSLDEAAELTFLANLKPDQRTQVED